MWYIDEPFAINDLHLASEQKCGLFLADEQLAELLDLLRKDLSDSPLFINGDAFKLPAGQQQETEIDPPFSVDQVAATAENYLSVFEALGHLAVSDVHEVTILGGNHDPEMVLPGVQRAIYEDQKPANPLPDPFPWLQTLQPLGASTIPLSFEVILPTFPGDGRGPLAQAVHIKNEGIETSAKLCQGTDQGVQVLSNWHFTGGAWERGIEA